MIKMYGIRMLKYRAQSLLNEILGHFAFVADIINEADDNQYCCI